MGNDINDLGAISYSGLSFCPSDSHQLVKKKSSIILATAGGKGVYREILEYWFKLDLASKFLKEKIMSVKIIAEIGINHNGDIETCKQIIDIAKNTGCDAVKFQKRDIDLVYTKNFLDSERESPLGEKHKEHKKKD